MADSRRGRAWKLDRTGERCARCARTWDGHAGTSCYPVSEPAIDAFGPARPELLELNDAADASRRFSPSRPRWTSPRTRVPRHHGAHTA